ncbi:MAG: bifunctional 23S rRNA (guanine(2069)-N(7))-methyltransferase RlmK/23S rRNA (guanine(2445)-N(2))-methyltransferase RlmL [Gammaproteobacteria bacterium]|nr:bifunctional 23S rRNA (guanine(2069)-N(7))-methyltransferase RlmK/23S rRNA (guanine(2445)-N(2))-methyltransferase RlmL [Gammaproteobacteria bacterium]
MKLFATTAEALVPLLQQELSQLGAERIESRRAGVAFQGDDALAYRCCLWSRYANRILLPVTSFHAATPEALYAGITEISWERHLHSSGTLAIDVTADRSDLKHSHYAMLTAKDAIVDRYRKKFNQRPDIDSENPDLRLHLLLHADRVQISVDLSGGSLHRRGYRQQGGAAPLKENLAAALLALAHWPEISREGGALYDPMCGSATLLIEAAMMSADIAPGLTRSHFGFSRWRKFHPEIWQAIHAEASQRRQQGLSHCPPIVGTDRDPHIITIANENITAAGLEAQISVSQSDRVTPPPVKVTPGLIIVNPPYGMRIGEGDDLSDAYQQLRTLHRENPEWPLVIFSGNPELVQRHFRGVVAPTPQDLNNGAIPCQLYQYPVRNADAATAPLSGAITLFANRLQKNLKHLQRWARREAVNCYRIYDADLPEDAVAIDLYPDIHGERWVHLQEYAAPSSIDPQLASDRLQQIQSALPQLLALSPEQIALKVRQRQRGKSQYRATAEAQQHLTVREAAALLEINLFDYLDTGLFLDHRPIRLKIAALAKGKRFLNLFCYSGSATVHAALGGAIRSSSVDLSPTYLRWCERNFALNQIDSGQHLLVQDDVLQWLERSSGRSNPPQYDLIFLDPPTFSNSKRSENTFDIQEAHPTLISQAMQLLAADGTLIFSTNFRRFKLDESLGQSWQLREITAQTIDEDFRRNPKIHRCWEIKHSQPS